MLNDTPLLCVNGKAKLGNFAGIPGTGPKGAVCLHCSNLATAGKTNTCRQFAILTGRKGAPIDAGTAACRYYQHRTAIISKEV